MTLVLDMIMKRLFQPDQRRLSNWINSLTIRNGELLKKNLAGFLYRGVWYQHSGILYHPRYLKHSLDLSLFSEMDAYLIDHKQVKFDQQVIRQVLGNVLRPCRSLEDVRDALPECVKTLIPDLNSIPRTRSEVWTLKDNERQYRQYIKTLPKIEMYAASRLIY